MYESHAIDTVKELEVLLPIIKLRVSTFSHPFRICTSWRYRCPCGVGLTINIPHVYGVQLETLVEKLHYYFNTRTKLSI